MRVVAIIAAYNEERFIAGCLDHLLAQGIEAYLIDNCSTDQTVEIAKRYLGRGLIGIETFPRNRNIYMWETILERKEELAASLEADWFMHMDPDEIRLPPRSDRTLVQAFAEIDEQGYNAANFLEFTFVPTLEAPDHDHPQFLQTMKWYYLYQRHFPFRVTAWKRRRERVALASSGGHRVEFPDLRLYPESFKMRHYLFLSVPHALQKYAGKKYDATELQRGWHDWRARLIEEKIKLPSQTDLHYYTSDDELNVSNPRTRHVTEEWTLPREHTAEPNARRVAAQGLLSPLRQARPNDGTRQPGSMRRSTPVCIGGMHCSGAAMVTKLLHMCGLYLGEERDLAQPAPDNSGAFAENRKFVAINEEILGEFGGGWDFPPSMPDGWDAEEVILDQKAEAETVLQEFSGHEPWGWKDPCNSLTLPFWRALIPNLRSVICLRNPLEIALSLHRRNGVSYALGLALWQTYYQRVLETTSAEDRIITHYDAFFHDPRAELRRVLDFLDMPVSEEGIDSCLSAVSIGLRHSKFTIQSLLDASVSPAVVEAYVRMCEEASWIDGGEAYRGSKANDLPSDINRWLRERNSGGGATKNTVPVASSTLIGGVEWLDRSAVEAELLKESYEARIEQYQERYRALMADHRKLKARGDNLENHLHSIENSRTWRLFSLYRRLRTKMASSSKSS